MGLFRLYKTWQLRTPIGLFAVCIPHPLLPLFAQVWSSSDGAVWTSSLYGTAFSPREGVSLVAFHSQLFLLGGFGAGYLLDEVWVSSDGSQWALASPMPGPLGYFAAVVVPSGIATVGGRNSSSDPVTVGFAYNQGIPDAFLSCFPLHFCHAFRFCFLKSPALSK